MRCIVVDAEKRTIEEMDIKGVNESLTPFYEVIGCDIVEFVNIDRNITMIIDECCKLKDFSGGFKFFGVDDLVITGRAVFLGMNNKGKFTALKEHIKTFHFIIDWVEKEKVPEPEFKIYSW